MLSSKMRNLERNYGKIRKFMRRIRKCKYSIENAEFETRAFFRGLGITNSKYKKLKEYKDLHNGERCFIIATGPSLTLEDIEKLKNEYTFGMNSLCLAFDQTDFRPTYFGIQDENVFHKVKESLYKHLNENVFVSDNIAKKNKILKEWDVFPLNISYHSYQTRYNMGYFSKFSTDCYRAVYDGYTITYSLIQLSMYMGFKEIYLIGADTNYSSDKNKQHFIESGHYDPTYKSAGERMISAYEVAKNFAELKNVKIYNATRGGMLEVFERVELDEIVGLKE